MSFDNGKSGKIEEIQNSFESLDNTFNESSEKINKIVKKLEVAENEIMNDDSDISYEEDGEFDNEEFEMYLNQLKTENPAEYELIMNTLRNEDHTDADHETIITYQMASPIYETVEGDDNRLSGMMTPVETKNTTVNEQNIPMIKKRYRISKAKKNEILNNTNDKKESNNLLSPPASPFQQTKYTIENQPSINSSQYIIETSGDNDIQVDSIVNKEEIDEELLSQIQNLGNLENGKSFISTTTTTTKAADVPEADGSDEIVVKKRIPIVTKDGKKAFIEVVEKTVVTTVTDDEEPVEIVEEVVEEEEEEEEVKPKKSNVFKKMTKKIKNKLLPSDITEEVEEVVTEK